MPGKRVSKNIVQLVYFNYYKGKTHKELAKMFYLNLRTVYNIINRAEKEGRLEEKHSPGRPKKVTERIKRKIIKLIDEKPHSSTRGIASEISNDLEVSLSHETVRNVLQKQQYFSRTARKKPLLSAQNIEKRYKFAIEHVNFGPEYWNDVIFCDESKLMLNYHDGLKKVWRKPLTALDNKNIIPTVKFGKLSVMVWACISSRVVGGIKILDDVIIKEVYLDILKNDLCSSARKFRFFNPENHQKLSFKFYQDNDPKQKSYICKSWLLYNCKQVIDTTAQRPDLNPVENLWVHLKKKVGKRSPKK